MGRAAGRWQLPPYGATVIGVAIGTWLLIAAVLAGMLWYERGREVDRARESAAATTALMEAHTASIFQVVDLALEDVARRLEAQPPPRHDAALRQVMAERLADMPYVRALFVIGPDGFIQHDTDYPRTPDVSLADREYFRLHQRDAVTLRSLSGPLQSRSGLGWFVAASRRIGLQPEFRGVVVAAIQLRYFSDLYGRMGLGEGHRIVLFHRDGRLVAQHPQEVGVIGAAYSDYPLFRTYLPRSPRGVYYSDGIPLSYPRLFSYAALERQPLVVGFVQDLDHVLAPWRHMAAAAAGGLLLLLLVFAAAVGTFLRFQSHRQRVRERMAQGEKMEALGQLTGSIAHDFANLLGIVSTNLELLRRTGAGDPRGVEAIRRATRALEGGTRMTRQLMSFARKRELEPVDVDLDQAIAGVLPLLQQAVGSGIAVTHEPAEGLPHCRLDRAQFDVALVNLVVNARDAMQGQGAIVLRTRAAERGAWRGVALAVQDTGPGMSDEVRRRALEPFFSTKGEGGTGLGLAQVYGFMRQIGGDVDLVSRPGEGLRVDLYFPAAPA